VTSTLLIVKKNSPFKTVFDLKGTKYGKINCYCTSSYFSLAILLKLKGLSIKNHFKELIDVPVKPGNWQNQIDQVINGSIDATMVDEGTWLKNPSNKDETRVIDRMDCLPTPLIIFRKDCSQDLIDSLKKQFLESPKISGKIFSGFVSYDKENAEAFFHKAKEAFS
jgi:phosphonate transport system substrate-binding protein